MEILRCRSLAVVCSIPEFKQQSMAQTIGESLAVIKIVRTQLCSLCVLSKCQLSGAKFWWENIMKSGRPTRYTQAANAATDPDET